MNTINTAPLSHSDAHAIAFAQTASTMFAMAPMFRHRPDHLKMPRLDAYGRHASVFTCPLHCLGDDGSQVGLAHIDVGGFGLLGR